MSKVNEDLTRGVSEDTIGVDQKRREVVISQRLEDVGLGEDSGVLEHGQVEGSNEKSMAGLEHLT